MALRSRLGGEARLQQAICLDSLGRNNEAYEIYKRIENHPAPGVAKKAKRWVPGLGSGASDGNNSGGRLRDSPGTGIKLQGL